MLLLVAMVTTATAQVIFKAGERKNSFQTGDLVFIHSTCYVNGTTDYAALIKHDGANSAGVEDALPNSGYTNTGGSVWVVEVRNGSTAEAPILAFKPYGRNTYWGIGGVTSNGTCTSNQTFYLVDYSNWSQGDKIKDDEGTWAGNDVWGLDANLNPIAPGNITSDHKLYAVVAGNGKSINTNNNTYAGDKAVAYPVAFLEAVPELLDVTISGSGECLSYKWMSYKTFPWSTDAVTDPTGLAQGGNNAHTATTNVTIEEAGKLTILFDYTGGGHRLDILGIDLLDENENVVASDYHKGSTGSSDSNNTYSVFATPGSYTLRYIVAHNTNGNDLTKTNGDITGTFNTTDEIKQQLTDYVEALRGIGMFDEDYINRAIQDIADANPSTPEEFVAMENIVNNLIATLDGKCFNFKTTARAANNPRYLGVRKNITKGTPYISYNVVATDDNDLENIWKIEYANENKFRLLNLAYNTYSKTTDQRVLPQDGKLEATISQDEAGIFFLSPQGNLVALGSGNGTESYIHDPNSNDRIMTRWSASGAASQWEAIAVEEPDVCLITYNHIFNGNTLLTEMLNVEKGTEYTFVNNYSRGGLRLKGEIPAAEVINEDKAIDYEYETYQPFEPATITDNRLAEGSKLYKITLRSKSVQYKTDGSGFEYNNNAPIENQLFAFTGAPLNNYQIFNYAAGLDKPLWAGNDNNGTEFLPTAGCTEKMELVLYNDDSGDHWSFKKAGKNVYLHDYNTKFAVWNDNTAYDAPGSYVTFTEATDKEISIATLNIDIKTATLYLNNDILDPAIKADLQSVVDEATAATADTNSTAAQLNEIDTRLYRLTQDAAADLNITKAESFRNTGVYTFVTSRGTLFYNSSNPDVVASTKAYGTVEYGPEYDYCQWTVYRSSITGNYYMYNLGAGKFVGDSNGQIPFVDTPTNSIKIIAGTKNGYPIIIATNNSSAINHYAHTGVPGVANWTGGQGDLDDDGNCHVVTKVALLDDATLENIANLVDLYETQLKKAELLEKIESAEEYATREYLPEDKRNGLGEAAVSAREIYNDTDAAYATVAEKIEELTELLNSSVFVTSPESFTNNAIYTIVAKYNGGSYVMYDAAQGDNGNYAISSSKFGTLETGENIPGCRWAMYKSAKGYYYLYNIGAKKFMGTTTAADGSIPMNEKPTSKDLICKVSADSEYPIMFSVNNGAGVLNHNTDSRFAYGLLNWHSTAGWNDTSSAANVHKVTVIGTLDEETLASIEDLVNNYETVGIKQQELKTLLDNIQTGYYDQWNTAWRIAPGLNNYSQKDGDEDFVAAYNDARTYETSEDIDAIQAQIDRMNSLVANLTINQPENGAYYKIRCTNGNQYLSSNTNGNGQLQMLTKVGAEGLFYYDGGFMSYSAGRHVILASGANNVKFSNVGVTTTANIKDGKQNKNKSGSYLIQIGGRWLHGAGTTADSGGNEPTNADGYNWWFETVEVLPVVVSNALYATFYAPVEVTLPDGVEAWYLTGEGVGGSYVSMTRIESGIVPAETAVILRSDVAGTYDLAISDTGAKALEENLFDGTVAAAYITDDAYVLSNQNGEIGLYKATKNQQAGTAFLSNSHKAYLPAAVLASTSQQSAGFRFNFGGTTAIEEVNGEKTDVNAIYDLQGRRINEMTESGIYIVNGRKVIVK